MGAIESISGEFRRYKALAEGAIAQLNDSQLSRREGQGNSVAIICRHLSGNLRARFTDFLTSDGEKAWRDRDAEFEAISPSRADLLADWEEGWGVLFAALEALREDDLETIVTIRRQPFRVVEALHRSLAHVCYHVGQIVCIARALRGTDWRFLSIPPGGSAQYNQDPRHERPEAHADSLRRRDRSG